RVLVVTCAAQISANTKDDREKKRPSGKRYATSTTLVWETTATMNVTINAGVSDGSRVADSRKKWKRMLCAHTSAAQPVASPSESNSSATEVDLRRNTSQPIASHGTAMSSTDPSATRASPCGASQLRPS